MDPSLQEREDEREREGRRGGEREERGEGDGAGENGAEVSGEAAGVASFQLMYMAHEGNAEGIRKPLDAGADPNFRDSDARTVLHISACEGHAEVVDLLLDRGAEAVVGDQWGSTMNVLLHMELTERMKIMPSHIMLTILRNKLQKRVSSHNRDLPPRNEQFISDFKHLCMPFPLSRRITQIFILTTGQKWRNYISVFLRTRSGYRLSWNQFSHLFCNEVGTLTPESQFLPYRCPHLSHPQHVMQCTLQ